MTGPSETDSGGTRTETDTGTPGPDEHAAPSPAAPDGAVPRAGAPRPPAPAPEHGPGWGPGARSATDESPTTVLPGGGAGGTTAPRRPPVQRPAGSRPASRVDARPAAGARPAVGRTRRARLAVRRIDPWSVFLFSLVASIFLGIALIVAVAVLYAVLTRLGVTTSLNDLFAEVTGGSAATDPLLTSGRIVGGAAVLSAVNVVFLTLLATLGSLLYNLCASFTGGIELTLGERD
jgi:hypothetical protein